MQHVVLFGFLFRSLGLLPLGCHSLEATTVDRRARAAYSGGVVTFYYALSLNEWSLLNSSEPAADAIWNALDGVVLPSGAQWVGPLAQITRRKDLSTHPLQTKVLWIVGIDGPYTPAGALVVARQVGHGMDQVLSSLSTTWTPTTVVPYDAARDGAIAAWQHGSAAVPRTIDNLPNGATELVESGLNRIGTAVGTALQPVQQIAKDIAIAAVAGVVIVGAVVFWPEISGALGFARSRFRKNPSSRSWVSRMIR